MINRVNMMLMTGMLTWLSSSVAALTLNGMTAFNQTIVLNAPVAATVKSISVKQGDSVNKGQLLIQMDDTAFQIEKKRAEAIARSLQPEVITAEQELERAQELYDRDNLSQIELSRAENRLQIAQGNYQAAQQTVELANYHIRQSRLIAPMDGQVVSLTVNPGWFQDPAAENPPMLQLVSRVSMQAIGLLTTEQWNRKLLGQSASVTIRGQQYSGTVERLGVKRIEQSSGLPAYEIVVSFKPQQLLPENLPVQISIDDP